MLVEDVQVPIIPDRRTPRSRPQMSPCPGCGVTKRKRAWRHAFVTVVVVALPLFGARCLHTLVLTPGLAVVQASCLVEGTRSSWHLTRRRSTKYDTMTSALMMWWRSRNRPTGTRSPPRPPPSYPLPCHLLTLPPSHRLTSSPFSGPVVLNNTKAGAGSGAGAGAGAGHGWGRRRAAEAQAEILQALHHQQLREMYWC